MPWRQQSRTAQARGDRMTCQCADDQQLYNCPTMTSWAHRGSLSKRTELVLSSLPTRPPLFSPSPRPPVSNVACVISFVFALHLYVSYVQSHHFPWLQPHELQSIRSSRLTAIRTHHPISHVSLGGGGGRGSFPVTAHGFSSKGIAAVRARRLFPSTISGLRGSVPLVPLGRKLD